MIAAVSSDEWGRQAAAESLRQSLSCRPETCVCPIVSSSSQLDKVYCLHGHVDYDSMTSRNRRAPGRRR